MDVCSRPTRDLRSLAPAVPPVRSTPHAGAIETWSSPPRNRPLPTSALRLLNAGTGRWGSSAKLTGDVALPTSGGDVRPHTFSCPETFGFRRSDQGEQFAAGDDLDRHRAGGGSCDRDPSMGLVLHARPAGRSPRCLQAGGLLLFRRLHPLGYGDVTLSTQNWRILSGMEAQKRNRTRRRVNGLLFAVVQRSWKNVGRDGAEQ
jgi:hypothetical protein